MLNLKPHEYVERLSENKHIMMLYDDEMYAKEVELVFVRKGLENGEHCIYIMHDGWRPVRDEWDSMGIDVDEEVKRGMLHIVGPGNHGELSGGWPDLGVLPSLGHGKVRVVGRWIPDIDTVHGISSELGIERKVGEQFRGINGSVMCTYPASKICSKGRSNWTLQIINEHDVVIFVTGPGEGRVHEIG